MKKSLLIWGALVIIALCFVGCCYYNTTHNNPCARHCKHDPCCNEAGKKCPDSQNKDKNADDDVESVTVEEVEIIPVGAPAQPAAPAKQPATQTPAN
jgi:FtsZ-interacting cell division protein ZipA